MTSVSVHDTERPDCVEARADDERHARPPLSVHLAVGLAAALLALLVVVQPWAALALPLFATAVALRSWEVPAAAGLSVAIAAGALVTVVPSAAANSLLPSFRAAAVWWVLLGLAPWAVARGVSWRRRTAALEERILRDELQLRALSLETAAASERRRTAERLHDGLGHDLSLLALRAAALEVAPGTPESARTAAAEIRAGVGSAVERLAEVVGLLRDGPVGEPAGRGPGELIEGTRAAGMELTASGLDVLEVHLGDPAAEVGRAVLEEGLGNAARHAPGRRVTVAADSSDGVLRIDVTTHDASGGGPAETVGPSSGGTGIRSLHERAAALGGRVHARWRDRDHVLAAEVSLEASHAGPAVTDVQDLAVTLRRSLLRARRRRWARAGIPLALSVTLLAAAQGIAWLDVQRSRLSPEAAALLRPGLPVDDVVLPARQVSLADDVRERLSADEVVPTGASCRFYSPADASPTSDSSGDVVRVCQSDGVIVMADVLEATELREVG